MTTITIIDETLPGKRHSFNLEFLDESITLREFIRRRVYEDVKDYNASATEVFRGLVQPSVLEQKLNPQRIKERSKIDWEAQYKKALEAFEGRGFIVLVDNVQVDDLDAQIELRTGTEVTFLKLVALVGG
jgi:hypothetical protein